MGLAVLGGLRIPSLLVAVLVGWLVATFLPRGKGGWRGPLAVPGGRRDRGGGGYRRLAVVIQRRGQPRFGLDESSSCVSGFAADCLRRCRRAGRKS